MLNPALQFPLGVKAVLFDLDGTLLDTIHDLAFSANRMLEALELASLSEELIKTFVGKGIPNLVKRTLQTSSGHEDIPENDWKNAIIEFEKQYAIYLTRKIQPFPEVIEGLNTIRNEGYRMVCITNKAERFTLPLLQAAKLDTYFELVISGDSLTKKKPDPMQLLHVADKFNISPSEMVLIGDSVNDYDAARAAGSYIFIVPYGYNEGRDATRLSADAIVSGLVEAAKLLKNVGRL